MPKAWRRTASAFGGGSSLPAPPTVNLLSVAPGDVPNSALWTFDTPIATEGSAAGFIVNGGLPGGSDGPSGASIQYTLYAAPINSGDDYQFVAALCTGLTFVGGGIPVDSAGSVL